METNGTIKGVKLMKEQRKANEFYNLADQFSRGNPQTAFLLRRMKAQDVYIYEHSLKAAYYSLLLAQGLALSGKEQERLYRSALLMDVGKLRLESGSGAKRIGLSAEESGLSILKHPEYSVDLLETLVDRRLVDGEAILHHHENLDGTGYPNCVSWEDISLGARVLRVADSFAAMVAYDRRTQGMAGVEQALDELYRWSNIMYDPDLVDLLCHCFGRKARERVGGRPSVKMKSIRNH
jgi:HD-GYP domain-containing protein (c-di-GMP phosphodiesterase class II)